RGAVNQADTCGAKARQQRYSLRTQSNGSGELSRIWDAMGLSRRELIRTGALAISASAFSSTLASPLQRAGVTQEPFRLAHLTDMHVKPECGAPDGYAKALQSLATLNPKPKFLITGGVHVMDTLIIPRQRADV